MGKGEKEDGRGINLRKSLDRGGDEVNADGGEMLKGKQEFSSQQLGRIVLDTGKRKNVGRDF